MNKKYLILLIIFLFFFRLIYGLCSEFWFEDEMQIYLLGLKLFTTNEWVYFGPDVVYTHSQIPGALQAILVGSPFYLLKIPEAPYFLLNIISFASLLLFSFYISKKLPKLPKWFILIIVFTTPWMLNFSTHIVNPSYVLPFSILFFISFFETIPFFKINYLPIWLCVLLMGISTTSIMQLHLSWVLLMPFTLLTFYYLLKEKNKLLYLIIYLLSLALGAVFLIPTFVKFGLIGTGGTEGNLVFNVSNFKNIITVLTRYLSLAAYEIPYLIGSNTNERINLIKKLPIAAPSTIILLITGWLQVVVFFIFLFKKNISKQFNIIKTITISTFILIFISFFFSIKGPSSHTFYIIIPIPLLFAFYCYDYLKTKTKFFNHIAISVFALSFILYFALIYNNLISKSLYLNRNKVIEAIHKKDYQILSNKRSDNWNKKN